MKKTTIIIAALFGAVLAYYLLFERGAKPAAEAARDAKRLFSLEGAQIETLKITRPEGAIRVEATADRKWRMTDPIRARADRSSCDAVASALADMERQREVKNEKGEAGLAERGFAPPRARVEFTLGPKAPADKGEGQAAHAGDTADAKTSPETETASARTQATADGGTTPAKGDTGAKTDKAPSSSVDERSSRSASSSNADAIRGASTAKVGSTVGGGSPIALEIGNDVPSTDSVFVRVEGKDDIFLVPQASVSALLKPLADFRDHSLLDVMILDVNEARIVRPQGDLRFRRRDDDWWIESPILDLADGSAVQNLLTAVVGLRADSFVDDPVLGLDPPQTSIRLLDKAGREIATVNLGSPIEGQKDKVYARVRAAEGAATTGLVSSGGLSSLSNPASEFRSNKALAFRSWETSGLNIVAPGTNLSLIKKDGVWTASSPAKLDVDATAVEDTLQALGDLEILSFGAPAGASPASLSLEPPATRIEVRPESPGGALRTLVLGTKAPAPDSIYARSPGRPGVFTVSSSILERIKGGSSLYAAKTAPEVSSRAETAPKEPAPTSR